MHSLKKKKKWTVGKYMVFSFCCFFTIALIVTSTLHLVSPSDLESFVWVCVIFVKVLGFYKRGLYKSYLREDASSHFKTNVDLN